MEHSFLGQGYPYNIVKGPSGLLDVGPLSKAKYKAMPMPILPSRLTGNSTMFRTHGEISDINLTMLTITLSYTT